MKKEIVIFDLDGTIALIDKRRELSIQDGKLNWDIFFNPENIHLDEPNIPVIKTLQTLHKDYQIYIFSGRSQRTRKVTENWLYKENIPYHLLQMRPENDYTPDDKLKYQWLHQLIQYDHINSKSKILCVFDDRDKVVNMWRNEGISCFQVAPGNF
ncbi:MAG: hypothetical protein PF569_01845 [Candidatus Woesearchaeota archaeon]|jgi:hypothetical protein|nr:hypothetical protein [Candidatus Woesearchaeota archaeon]